VSERDWTLKPAVLSQVPLWIGLFGPSGGGKTFSALRLATGMQKVMGGKIGMLDTEGGRGSHYANMFKYERVDFFAPFGSLDYLSGIQSVVKQGANIIIVDSMSHEHEGPGGMVDFHAQEVARMAKGDEGKAERVKMLAWAAPKAARRKLINSMLAIPRAAFILCFRAGDSSKPVKDSNGKTEVVHMGFVPIAGKEFVFECTIAAYLPPGADGVPEWKPESPGEKMMVKLPAQFRDLFSKFPSVKLSEDQGKSMAEWARGGADAPAKAERTLADRAALLKAAISVSETIGDAKKVWDSASKLRSTLMTDDADLMTDVCNHYNAKVKTLKGAEEL
jgi:hypothetical protein